MHRPILTALLACVLLSPSSLAQDSLTLAALQRIEKYEKLEPDLEPGDVATANLYLNGIQWAAKRLNAVSDKSEATWKEAKARYDALNARIVAKAKTGGPEPSGGYDYAKLTQLNKEIGNAFENLKILSVKNLQDEFRVKSIKKELADFGARLGAFPADDDNVKLVAGNLASFRKLFETGMAQLAEGQAAKGGVLARIEELRAKYESKNTPGNLSHPFEEQQLRAWAAEMKRWRTQEIPTDVAWLQQAAGNAAVDQQPVNSLYHWLTGTWARRLDEVEKLVRERVASDVAQGQDTADFILETDVSQRDQVLNRVLGRGRFDENMTWLRDAEHAVAMARVYDEAMGSPAVFGPTITDPALPAPAQPDRDAQAAKVARALAHLEQIAAQALDEVRMPPPASEDAELLRIASETLQRPEYEVAGWERLVINSNRQSKVRREAWIKPGSTYTTLSYYEYAWDEFQVTTAEKAKDDQLWLFANTLKLYSSGDPTTPVGRWILSRRFELTPILAENLAQ